MSKKMEILQLISATWINAPKSGLSIDYIARYWCIDSQWMDISEAEILINKLIEAGWILRENDGLFPNFKIDPEIIKFGWKPNLKITDVLPKSKEVVTSSLNTHTTIEKEIPGNKLLNEKLSNSERRLIRYISANTGILKEEVFRRCMRKKRALSQITTKFCLLLIAKEQGMNMEEFV